ncbi:MoaD/ThiS family protein [Rufibacter sp. LB8]|uniref:MoaD/ThiS family protein n=1 Tax=Rufibacter sp. LB8 TaxID=2777781 RepID=UPI00178C2EC1|nr:MoaD/ThiS family protein [Rufibacter sp. LB8]
MNILLFGITRDIVGQQQLSVPSAEIPATVHELKIWLVKQYPALQNLSSLAVAVNNEYAQLEDTIPAGAEIALIPPVSGG